MSRFSICGQTAANTGTIDCDVARGVPQLLVFGSAIFTTTDYATTASFKAAFLAKIKQANTVSSKLFPLPVIQQNNDKTVAAKEATLGYGLIVKLLRSKPGYEMEVLAGSSLEKKLIKWDKKVVPVFVFDDNSNIWGVTDTTGNFSGANYLISVEPRGFGDGQNAKTTKISMSIISSADFTENSKFASTDFSTNDLTGLLDAVLYQTAVPAANVYHIGAKILTDALNSFVNVHDNYAALLSSGALWVALKGASFGTTQIITSVVDDPTNGGWTVTFDSTTFTALASGAQIKLNFIDPTTLDTAGVVGIEGNYMIITKP